MEDWNTKSEAFIKLGLETVRDLGEIVVLICYPLGGGNKDFFLLRSEAAFLDFLSKLTPKQSVTFYRKMELVREGIIDQDFITTTLNELGKPKFNDWILLIPGVPNYGHTSLDLSERWNWVENKYELEVALTENMGNYVKIIEDIEFIEEDLIVHAYVPDAYGIVRPSRY